MCIRDSLKRVYDSTLYDSGTINAMVLGEKADLRPETRELYKDSGISHILAISGLHISIIGMMVFGLLRKTGFSRCV